MLALAVLYTALVQDILVGLACYWTTTMNIINMYKYILSISLSYLSSISYRYHLDTFWTGKELKKLTMIIIIIITYSLTP